MKFTFGRTNTSLNCTTVHFVQKCQVSTGNNIMDGLDHASWDTNMRSDSELVKKDNSINDIYKPVIYNTEKNSSILLKSGL